MTYRDELRAALDRAEAAERRLEAVCAIHPQAPVAAQCALCAKHLCTACVMMSIAGTFCGGCFVKERQRELRRRLAVVTAGVGAIVVSVLGAIWFWRPTPVVVTPTAVTPRPSEDELLAAHRARLATKLAADPCNRPVALELAEANNRAHELVATLSLTDSFLQRCGSFPRLLWSAYYAREERGEYEQAAAIASALIVNDPSDMDFWIWRGDALAGAGRNLEATADYRQAVALGANRVAPWRLAEVAEKVNAPCEAAFALAWSFDQDADNATAEAEARRRQLALAGCADLATGVGELRLQDSDDSLVATPILVGGKRASFAIDLRSGVTVLDTKLAAQLGITGASPTIWVLVDGKVIPANLAKVSSIAVGEAQARDVTVAVADLPREVDGVLGLSFFWRFALVHTEDGSIALDAR